MAFVLSSARRDYWWPLVIDIPKDGGGYRRATCKLLFKWLPQSEVEQIIGVEAELNHAMQLGRTERMNELLPIARQHAARIILGWDDIFENEPEVGQPPSDKVPFTDSNLADFLETPGLAGAVLKTYSESLPQVKAKN